MNNKKTKFPEILKKCKGIVSEACKALSISRTTYYKWREADPDFATECDDIEEVVMDFVEGKLLELIDEKNPAAIIFYSKTKGKRRGYIERNETHLTGKDGGAIKNDITLTGFDAELFQRAREDDRAEAVAKYKAAELLETN